MPDSCLLLLPGRGQHGASMVRIYAKSALDTTLLIGVTPQNYEWYPMPNGPDDQKEALEGQLKAARAIMRVMRDVEYSFSIPINRIALAGFSAGAVMSIYTVAFMGLEVAGVVSHGGAVLHPLALPEATTNTPILLQHNEDDSAFDWDERYLPGKLELKAKGYRLFGIERPKGGHTIWGDDVILSSIFLAKQLGYPEDFPSRYGGAVNRAVGRAGFIGRF